jgi:hypothetical protein
MAAATDDVIIPHVKKSSAVSVHRDEGFDVTAFNGRFNKFVACGGCSHSARHGACIETSRVLPHHKEDGRWFECTSCRTAFCSEMCTKNHTCPNFGRDLDFALIDGSAFMDGKRDTAFPYVHCLREFKGAEGVFTTPRIRIDQVRMSVCKYFFV